MRSNLIFIKNELRLITINPRSNGTDYPNYSFGFIKDWFHISKNEH